MPIRKALLRGAFAAVVGMTPLWKGQYWAGLALMIGFWVAGTSVVHFLLRTALHAAGLTIDGVRHFKWGEVAEARFSGENLKLGLLHGTRAELSAAVVSEPTFLAAVERWLPAKRPIRRALRKRGEP
jgi:hypothetical protein